ncbi:hypothetical protein ACFZAI_12885 [Achromobacter sp. NPDC008082]|uniref:hypothetical protein n=1 Tax=Achromobacter sp. NPDC008082 TaxID=3363888 RepID=UPI0036F119B9
MKNAKKDAKKTPAISLAFFLADRLCSVAGGDNGVLLSAGIHVVQDFANGAAQGGQTHFQTQPHATVEWAGQGFRFDGLADQGPLQRIRHTGIFQRGIAHDSLLEKGDVGQHEFMLDPRLLRCNKNFNHFFVRCAMGTNTTITVHTAPH